MSAPDRAARCPDCGTPLTDESWAQGMCLSCLARLAVEQPSLHAEMIAELRGRKAAGVGDDALSAGATPLDTPTDRLTPGAILGNRYQIRSRLGRGGMGEVWLAFDLKLRVDVALKAVHSAFLASEKAIQVLRSEVRSAREVVSPNVCRVYQLEELGDRELVSMEYVDGQTLAEVLRERSPLELDEAREIAAQLLAGLEAIHAAGLVHRDIKPENVMLTRAGRVVVMDFGVAKALAADPTKTVSGTPAYMAPEQARGGAIDARADLYSVGIVLAEIVAPAGARTQEAREAIWEGARAQPPELDDTPWRSVLVRAVAPEPADRHESAASLARALEDVTQRAGDAEAQPYPGVSSFTAETAEYFFGRELEVEEMGRKLQRAQLLALIGPSGAGKSSFLRAGLLPALPEGWRAVVAAPGTRPFMALGEALVAELSGDEDSIRELLRFEEADVAVALVSRWRKRHSQALIVLDQFEELFTLNPMEIQERFADLLGRLAVEADVRVLLAMRDDFLFRCHPFDALKPVLSELTLLGPLTGSGLRRALVQPALKCGYRFEDDALVDEMVQEVENERGALPLLAFAAAQLWRHRDRDQGLLTREAHQHVGGVGGALARHAEATLEDIGREREDRVREIFRNLATAEGTRAARSRDDLVSVFGVRRLEGEDVLDALIDARLLTSYDVSGTTGDDATADPELCRRSPR